MLHLVGLHWLVLMRIDVQIWEITALLLLVSLFLDVLHEKRRSYVLRRGVHLVRVALVGLLVKRVEILPELRRFTWLRVSLYVERAHGLTRAQVVLGLLHLLMFHGALSVEKVSLVFIVEIRHESILAY